MRPVTSIVIVGGGTAGWLTAAVVAARHRHRIARGHLSVTLVESPNIPILGVGEGTWPTMRTTLHRIGVSETEFFRECRAAFKQGAKFARWTTGEADDFYYHPLALPQGFTQLNLVPHWLERREELSFCDAVTAQGYICEANLAPKTIATPEYDGLVNYAYHLDAGKFAAFLSRHCTEKLGVRHVLADVEAVEQAEDGDITAVITEPAGPIAGDLFVDCTGFAALLLGKTLGVPFKPCDEVLFCDTALAMQVPYPDEESSPVASHTISTAQSAGWIWDIGLPTRRGTGYVYSSRHIDHDAAEAELRAYVGPAAEGLSTRRIPIRAGHRERYWERNCLAIGVAAGFLEPLESSAIVLIELSARILAEQLPACREVMDTVAKRFNETTTYRWGRIIDFLKLHYCISQRRDTPFWRDNVEPGGIPDRLRELMALWRYQPPWMFDEFDRLEEIFPAASYQYVLYGMRYETAYDADDLADSAQKAARLMSDNARMAQQMRSQLPAHRELLRKIDLHGLQRI
jgi:tryptophan halogenase